MSKPSFSLPPVQGHGDVNSYLNSVNSELTSIKSSINATIQQNLPTFVETLEFTSKLHRQVDQFSQELQNVKEKFEDPNTSLISTLIDSTTRRKELIDQERHTNVLIKILQAVTETNKFLYLLDELTQAKNMIAAIKTSENISNRIEALPGNYSQQNQPLLYGSVSKKYIEKKDALQKMIEEALEETFQFSVEEKSIKFLTVNSTQIDPPNSLISEDTSNIDTINFDFATAFFCLSKIDARLENKIQVFCSKLASFIDLIIPDPSLDDGLLLQDLELVKEINETHICLKLQKKQLSSISSEKTSQLNIIPALSNLIDLISFIDEVFIQRLFALNVELSKTNSHDLSSSISLQIGNHLLPHITNRLIVCCFQSSIPEEIEQVEIFQKQVLQEIDRFIPILSSFGWITHQSSSKEASNSSLILDYQDHHQDAISSLRSFLKDTDLHFALKKRKTMLTKARALLLSGKYTSALVGSSFGHSSAFLESSDKLFDFPQCKVREVIIEFLDICYSLLDDASRPTQSPRNASIFVETVRDILDLYRVIVPSYEQNKIFNIPALSMLFHNDFLYMAHHILIFGAKYRLKIGFEATSDSILPSFVDIIPSYRAIAENFYQKIIQEVDKELLGHLQSTSNLESSYIPENKTNCVNALRLVSDQIEKLNLTWKPILHHELHLVTMGHLLNEVCGWMITTVQRSGDIPEPATHSLQHLFSLLFPLAKIFVTDPNDNPRSSCSKYVRNWAKFEDMADIFTLSMVDIVKGFNSGKFDFERDEMASMIESLFISSQKRSDLIASLQAPKK